MNCLIFQYLIQELHPASFQTPIRPISLKKSNILPEKKNPTPKPNFQNHTPATIRETYRTSARQLPCGSTRSLADA